MALDAPRFDTSLRPFTAPETGILLTQFIVSEDIARSRDFYADVLGGEVVLGDDRLAPLHRPRLPDMPARPPL
jgi:hypothetical protein